MSSLVSQLECRLVPYDSSLEVAAAPVEIPSAQREQKHAQLGLEFFHKETAGRTCTHPDNEVPSRHIHTRFSCMFVNESCASVRVVIERNGLISRMRFRTLRFESGVDAFHAGSKEV